MIEKRMHSKEVAYLITTAMFKIWNFGQLEHPTPVSQKLISDFYAFVYKTIKTASPNITPTVLMTSLLYVKRLRHKTNQIKSGNRAEFRIWLTSLILADSFMNDHSFSNKSWAQISGFSAKECSIMQRELLSTLDYNLNCSEHEFKAWTKLIYEKCSLRKPFIPLNKVASRHSVPVS
jgi:hypothetical protein